MRLGGRLALATTVATMALAAPAAAGTTGFTGSCALGGPSAFAAPGAKAWWSLTGPLFFQAVGTCSGAVGATTYSGLPGAVTFRTQSYSLEGRNHTLFGCTVRSANAANGHVALWDPVNEVPIDMFTLGVLRFDGKRRFEAESLEPESGIVTRMVFDLAAPLPADCAAFRSYSGSGTLTMTGP